MLLFQGKKGGRGFLSQIQDILQSLGGESFPIVKIYCRLLAARRGNTTHTLRVAEKEHQTGSLRPLLRW